MFDLEQGNLIDSTFHYYLVNSFFLIGSAVFLSLPLIPWLQTKPLFRRIEPITATVIFLLSLIITVSSSYNPFIYFNF